MSTKAVEYVVSSLAASGIAVCHHQVAAVVRPGHWYDGVEARGDLASQRTRVAIGALPGVQKFTVRLHEIPDDVLVLARSADVLASRIEWLTGMHCLEIRAIEPAASLVPSPPSTSRPLEALDKAGDRFAGRVTKEAPRNCSGCERFTAGHHCADATGSGIDRPNPKVDRRCLAFVPLHTAIDGRTGKQLWPELTN